MRTDQISASLALCLSPSLSSRPSRPPPACFQPCFLRKVSPISLFLLGPTRGPCCQGPAATGRSRRCCRIRCLAPRNVFGVCCVLCAAPLPMLFACCIFSRTAEREREVRCERPASGISPACRSDFYFPLFWPRETMVALLRGILFVRFFLHGCVRGTARQVFSVCITSCPFLMGFLNESSSACKFCQLNHLVENI